MSSETVQGRRPTDLRLFVAVLLPDGLRADVGRLAGLVRQAAEVCGITLDARPFKSHVTLARVRHARQRAAMCRALESVRVPELGSFPVDTFHLVRSRLTPDGPVHTPLAEFKLAQAS